MNYRDLLGECSSSLTGKASVSLGGYSSEAARCSKSGSAASMQNIGRLVTVFPNAVEKSFWQRLSRLQPRCGRNL